MAQRTGAPAHGHNSGEPLTDEEFDDLVLYYSRVIRAQEAKAALKKAEYDAEKAEVNGLYSKMKGDLKYKRFEFAELLADQEKTAVELQNQEARRSRLYLAAGMRVGTQLQLFPAADTVTDQAQAQAEGRRAYLAYKDPIPPGHISPILHPDWMEGWHDEQMKTAMRMARAEAFIAKRAEPDAEAEAVDLNAEGEGAAGGGGPDEGAGEGQGDEVENDHAAGEDEANETPSVPDPAEVARQAQALEDSGFTATARRSRSARSTRKAA